MSVSIEDYIRSIKEEIITARENDVKGFLVKPSPAQLRNLCLLLLDEGLNHNDKAIFESFFNATKEEDLTKKIKYGDIDKFRPIRNLLEGAIENPTPINLELTAILIAFKKRPYKNFSKGVETEIKEEIKNEEALTLTVNNETIPAVPKKNNIKKVMYGGLGLVALATFGILGNNYKAQKEFQCMQWQRDHYEKVDCEMKNAPGAMYVNQVEVIDENAINLKKMEVTPATTFFVKNKAVVYYCKINDSILEYFNAPGFHPVLEKPLKSITPYIIKKYIK